MKPASEASGVRSSWLALARKSTPRALHAAHLGLVVEADHGDARPVGRLAQWAGVDAEAAGLGADRLEHAVGVSRLEQGLVDGAQHLGVADRREQQAVLQGDPQQLARRGVGQHETAAG